MFHRIENSSSFSFLVVNETILKHDPATEQKKTWNWTTKTTTNMNFWESISDGKSACMTNKQTNSKKSFPFCLGCCCLNIQSETQLFFYFQKFLKNNQNIQEFISLFGLLKWFYVYFLPEFECFVFSRFLFCVCLIDQTGNLCGYRYMKKNWEEKKIPESKFLFAFLSGILP